MTNLSLQDSLGPLKISYAETKRKQNMVNAKSKSFGSAPKYLYLRPALGLWKRVSANQVELVLALCQRIC